MSENKRATASSKTVAKGKTDKEEVKAKAPVKAKAEPKVKAPAKVKAEPKAKAPAKAKTEQKAKAPAAGKAKKSYKPVGIELAELVASAAAEHKPIDPLLLDLTGLSSIADWFFVASGENPRQMTAIAEKIIRRARDHGVKPLGQEGLGGEHWVLVDLGDVIVHIFNRESREMYDLEGLWTEAPRKKA